MVVVGVHLITHFVNKAVWKVVCRREPIGGFQNPRSASLRLSPLCVFAHARAVCLRVCRVLLGVGPHMCTRRTNRLMRMLFIPVLKNNMEVWSCDTYASWIVN